MTHDCIGIVIVATWILLTVGWGYRVTALEEKAG